MGAEEECRMARGRGWTMETWGRPVYLLLCDVAGGEARGEKQGRTQKSSICGRFWGDRYSGLFDITNSRIVTASYGVLSQPPTTPPPR